MLLFAQQSQQVDEIGGCDLAILEVFDSDHGAKLEVGASFKFRFVHQRLCGFRSSPCLGQVTNSRTTRRDHWFKVREKSTVVIADDAFNVDARDPGAADQGGESR